MTIKKGFCFLLCICVLFAVVTGCSSKKSGQAITYNLEEEPVTLDPQIADDYSSRICISWYRWYVLRSKPDFHFTDKSICLHGQHCRPNCWYCIFPDAWFCSTDLLRFCYGNSGCQLHGDFP